MTEAEWLGCEEPRKLLRFLQGRVSQRKRRLFACACCRRIWPFLSDDLPRAAIETAERYADGRATKKSLTAARKPLRQLVRQQHDPYWQQVANRACLSAAEDAPLNLGDGAIVSAWSAVLCHPNADRDHDERKSQCELLRDIVGDPFQPLSFAVVWRTTLPKAVAQLAYEERHLPAGTLDPARLAVLADALEDAGCADPELLGHLRGAGPHVRGCWVLDLILGKA